MRLNKQQAKVVKDGLFVALSYKYKHPDALPNQFGDIWINDAQKRGYLRRMADAGRIWRNQKWRGWYSWCTYRRPDDMEIPF